jgi:hypothetical protein
MVLSELQEHVRCMDLTALPVPFRGVLARLQSSESTPNGGSASTAFDLSALSSAWHGCDGTEQSVNFGPVGEPTLLTLTVADKKALAPFVNKHYVDSPFPPVLSPRAAHYMRFRAWGDHYGSWHSRYAKTSNVLVQWSIFGQDRVYPERIKRFIQVETSIPLCSAATVELAK